MQKVSIQIIKNVKKQQVQTNERTDTLDPYDLFSKGLRRSMK